MSRRFYNCHAHCFTYDHVPEHFIHKRLTVAWLLRIKWLQRLVRETAVTERFPFSLRVLLFTLRYLFGFQKSMAVRFLSFVRYGDRATQQEVIESMQAYYPKDTGLVMLTMDMAYMGSGKIPVPFEAQLAELAALKQDSKWKNTIYPFIFCDPRRLEETHKREAGLGGAFVGERFRLQLEKYLTDKSFQGIKLYPALGYYPFDKRMKQVYDFAVENEIPILTHCTVGAVHYKYELDNAELEHPILQRKLPRTKAKEFQKNFTHPLNFECLLNKDLLSRYWGAETSDYRNLKICLGHWGSGDDWHAYLNKDWLETSYQHTDMVPCSLDIRNWITEGNAQYRNFSWFTIICDLIRKYPNVYADISYTLHDATLLPLLKMILEADLKIRERVLFGTDFYLVSKAGSERAFAIGVRAALGNEMFEQIAIVNAERFLGNKHSPLPGAAVEHMVTRLQEEVNVALAKQP